MLGVGERNSDSCQSIQITEFIQNYRVSVSTVDDSLFLGTWTDKQSSIPYHDVCDAGLDFVGFFSLRSDMSAIWLW
ncbi:hypothetical protein TNCV_3799191 [Trichonephila clavipes]|nr:hypothetical protein TNCV_3799191 [Trichonephila clavipes]